MLTARQRRGTFALPIRQAVLVPSTQGIRSQKKLTSTQFKTRVNSVRRWLSSKFGGYTSIKATGGYILANGRLVKEKVVRVESFSTREAFNKNKSALIRQLKIWARQWGQESVGYEFEDDLILFPRKRKTRMTTSRRRKLLANLRKARAAKKRKKRR